MAKTYYDLIRAVQIIDRIMQRPYFPQRNLISLVSALSQVPREEILWGGRKQGVRFYRMAIQYLLVKKFGRANTTAAELTGAREPSGALTNVATMQGYIDWVHERYPSGNDMNVKYPDVMAG